MNGLKRTGIKLFIYHHIVAFRCTELIQSQTKRHYNSNIGHFKWKLWEELLEQVCSCFSVFTEYHRFGMSHKITYIANLL
jgi:hypothetical protein